MSLRTRLLNVFRREQLHRDMDEELASHLAEAREHGRSEQEARRALGPALRLREEGTEAQLLPWLDSLRADAVLGWRQIAKHKVLSLAVVLSLGLAMGASTAAFRLVDALLLRPLPVEAPEQLYSLVKTGTDTDGKPRTGDSWNHLLFRQMRTTVASEAQLAAVSGAGQSDITFQTDAEIEKAWLQYVSGGFFPILGLRPAAGRLLSPDDDRTPRAHPVAVLSHDYWMRRFQGDRAAVGRTFRYGKYLYQIVGVVQSPFTGTEPGSATDIFIPTMMHDGSDKEDWTWHRILARIPPSVPREPLRARLHAASRNFEENRLKKFAHLMTPDSYKRFLGQTVQLQAASAGASRLQRDFRPALLALSALVGLVLLIACANVANLLTARSSARAQEMALRVSIGAGRARLVQLILVECAMLGLLAAAAGLAFSAWAAPFVLSMLDVPTAPLRLGLPFDLRVTAFATTLTLAVICLFGVAPALRASSVRPNQALRAGQQPRTRYLQMRTLIAVQVAFCFLVLFLAGLFVSTSRHLAAQPLGFQPDGLLMLSTVSSQPQPFEHWRQLEASLRSAPGVQATALARWPLIRNNSWNGFISINGGPPLPTLAQFLNVSPAWLDTMRLPLLRGRQFNDTDKGPGVALVNRTFAEIFFPNQDPIGRTFGRVDEKYEIVGVVADAPYRQIREPILPVAYVPMAKPLKDDKLQLEGGMTILVRTSGSSPLSLAPALAREIGRLRPGFRVSESMTQQALIDAQTVRERLLAVLSLFFAAVAMLLAAVGLYGVLDYAVLRQRREIGIRMAIGARPWRLGWTVVAPSFAMVLTGAAIGLGLGLYSAKFIDTLLFGVKPNDYAMLALPWLTIALSSLLAAGPAVRRAITLDPVSTLRGD